VSDEPKIDNPIASLGGKASAAKLTPEERRERAKKAAEGRWAAGLPIAKYGSPDHPLRIGNIEINCFVLNDTRRILHQRAMVKALGMARGSSGGEGGDRLAKFVSGDRLKDFVNEQLIEVTTNPIKFRTPTNSVAYGYEATVLADICDAVLAARKAGVLQKQQMHIAEQCEILVRGFARVGIIALVDEATGYQYDRMQDELQRILEQYISKELARYSRVLEPDFYKHVYRLKGWRYDPTSTKRTHAVARITVDLIYDRIHPNLLKELKQVRSEKGKQSQQLHRWLTTDANGGHPRVKQQAEGITALVTVAPNWGQFQEWVDTRYPKFGHTLRIPFPEQEDEKETEGKKS
jgi:hypothetical protein